MNKIYLVSVAFLLGTSAHAAHYGMAGCGLGSQVMKENTLMNQVLGATTNGTSGNQTFGISSGTSNCTSEGTVRHSMLVPAFIEANQEALAKDSARGSGETIANLADLMGCSDPAVLGASLRKNFGVIFNPSNLEPAMITASVVKVVRADAELQSCANLPAAELAALN